MQRRTKIANLICVREWKFDRCKIVDGCVDDGREGRRKEEQEETPGIGSKQS